MTDMGNLRRKLEPFLVEGVLVGETKLEAGEALTLSIHHHTVAFIPIGDDHTYLEVQIDGENCS